MSSTRSIPGAVSYSELKGFAAPRSLTMRDYQIRLRELKVDLESAIVLADSCDSALYEALRKFRVKHDKLVAKWLSEVI